MNDLAIVIAGLGRRGMPFLYSHSHDMFSSSCEKVGCQQMRGEQ